MEKEYIRDRHGKIIGSKTSGFANDDVVVRDASNQIVGTASTDATRDRHGNIMFRGSQPDLLLDR
jgi:hypothetical protein